MNRAWIRRGAALAIAGACALAASGCSSTTSTNAAATATYKDSAGTHTVSVPTKDLLDQVGWLQEKKETRQALLAAGAPTSDSPDTAGAGLTANWLTRMLRQAVYDSVFDRQHLKVSETNRQDAQKSVPQDYGAAWPKFPKSLQNALIDNQARQNAIQESKSFLDPSDCKSNRLVSLIGTDTDAKAKAAYNAIKGGKAFGEVARTSSLLQNGQVGGLLGCLTDSGLPTELRNAANAVPMNVVTVPISASGGFFLVYVQPFDEFVRNPNSSAVLPVLAGASMGARFASLDNVKVNPRFGTWGLVQSQQGPQPAVIPPSVPDPRSDGATTTTLPAAQLVPQGG